MNNPPKRMYVFDLDGVVTNPEDGQINNAVLDYIAQDLHHGQAVALNTGRPYTWVADIILSYLRQKCSLEALEHLLVVAEMGGVVCWFEHGEPRIEFDKTLSLPPGFATDIDTILQKPIEDRRYRDYVVWDSTKKTMGTLMKLDHVALYDFNRIRPTITQELELLMNSHRLDEFTISQTTIAIDIQHTTAGKHKGAQQILHWLEQKTIKPEVFYAFGDSVSDKAMAEAFAATGAQTVFVFVGSPDHGEAVKHKTYETVITGGGHDQDTALYVAELEKHI